MREAPIRYRLEKASAARWLGAAKIQYLLAWSATTLLTTIAVQIGLLPMMIFYFHRVSLSSPLANLVEGALVFAVMIAGVLFLGAQALISAFSPLLSMVTNWLGETTMRAAEFLAAWPAKSINVADRGILSFVFDAVFFALLCIFIFLLDRWNPCSRKMRPLQPLLILSPIFITLTWAMVFLPSSPDFARGRLSLTFLDVGQGDAIVVAFPQGQIMLLDCGGRPSFGVDRQKTEDEHIFIEDRAGVGARAVAPFLWHRGVQRIDLLAASHSDTDHVQGFPRSRETSLSRWRSPPPSNPKIHFPSKSRAHIRNENGCGAMTGWRSAAPSSTCLRRLSIRTRSLYLQTTGRWSCD
jgi:competence protein ComEC